MRRAALLLLSACLAAQGLPRRQEFTLPNGLHVRLAESHESSVLAMRLVIRSEGPEDPPGKAGLSLWLASVMEDGGAGPYRSHGAWVRAMEESGLRLAFTHARGQWTWTFSADSRLQDQAAEQLAHAAFRPLWDLDLAVSCREKLIAELQTQTNEERANERFKELLGLAPVSAASPETLKVLDSKDLEEHRARLLRPERATLLLQGDLTLSQARQLALLHFGTWSSGEVASLPTSAHARSASTNLVMENPSGDLHLWLGEALPLDSAEAVNVARLLPFLTHELEMGKPLTPLVTRRWVSETALGRSGLWIEATATPGTTADQALEALRKEWDQGCARFSSGDAFTRARRRLGAEETTMALHPELLLERLSEETLDCSENLALPRFQALLKSWMDPSSTSSLVLGPPPARP